MNYTPGPWVIYRNRKGHVSKIEGSGGRRICTFQPSDQFVEGNSQIIVTALEMRDEIARLKKEKAELLEALNMFVDLANNIETYGVIKSESDWCKVKYVRDVAWAAIKKARRSE